MVAHDNNLRRLTGKQSFITETDFNNLPQIQDKVIYKRLLKLFFFSNLKFNYMIKNINFIISV